MKTSAATAFKIDVAIQCAMMVSGVFYKNPKKFYMNTGYIFGLLTVFVLGTEICISILGKLFGKVNQDQKKAKPTKVKTELLLQQNCIFLVSLMAAWPYTRYQEGELITYVPTLKESFVGDSILMNVLYGIVAYIFIDIYTYWKHYHLHTPGFMAFHEHHHQFANPTVFTSFAVGPYEALTTFGLIYVQAFKFSEMMPFYLPVHGCIMGFQVILNVYLHCGYKFGFIEYISSRILLNSSGYHNNHHEKTVTHFSELLLLWDYFMNTGPTRYNAKKFEEQQVKKAQLKQQKEA